jgi:hypothetical protein
MYSCPNCSASVPPAAGLLSCAKCEWSSDTIEKRLRSIRRFYGVSVILLFMAALWMELFAPPRWAALILSTSALIAIGGWTWVSRVWAASQIQRENDSQQWAFWAQLPRPRPVRVTEHARFARAKFLMIVALFVGLTTLLAVSLVRSHAYPPDRLRFLLLLETLPCLAGTIILVSSIAYSFRKAQRLVSTGNLIVGQVMHSRPGARGFPFVTYRFDPSGRTIFGACTDVTRTLTRGAPLMIFYNPERPKRDHVAACNSSYEIASR